MNKKGKKVMAVLVCGVRALLALIPIVSIVACCREYVKCRHVPDFGERTQMHPGEKPDAAKTGERKVQKGMGKLLATSGMGPAEKPGRRESL